MIITIYIEFSSIFVIYNREAVKKQMKSYNNIEQLRSYSRIFSSTSFLRLIQNGDFSFIDKKIERFDTNFIGNNKTYKDYIRFVYNILLKKYRCEYIYKNSLICDLIKDKYQFKESVVINEFKVGKSIVDLAIFNGVSKAFEIKTELDTSKRLDSQLTDYKKLFNKSYIVTHSNLASKYLNLDEDVGIIALHKRNNCYELEELKAANFNPVLDAEVLIKSLRTKEYKNIVQKYFEELPKVSSFKLFESCLSLLKEIPKDELNQLFLAEIKKRETNKNILLDCPKELKNICLSLNLNKNALIDLEKKLNQYI